MDDIIKSISYISNYANEVIKKHWIELTIIQNSKNDYENTSNITLELVGKSYEEWDSTFTNKVGYIEVNGLSIVSITSIDLNNMYIDNDIYYYPICSITTNFNHNSDGSLSLDVKGYFDFSDIIVDDIYILQEVECIGTFIGSITTPNPTISIQNTISTENSITIYWESNCELKNIYYRYSLDNGNTYTNWVNKNINSSISGSIVIGELVTGNEYIIELKGKSTAGIISSTISTNKSTITEVIAGEFVIDSIITTVEDIVIKWSCNKNIKTLRYITESEDSEITLLDITPAKNGTFKFNNLTPNTSYLLKINGIDEDSLNTNSVTLFPATKDYSRININNPEIIFGETILEIPLVTPDNTSIINFEFYVKDELIISQTTVNSLDKAILTLSDDLLDFIYKLFGMENTLPIKYKVITKASIDYIDEVSGILKLTGDAKTAKVCIGGNIRRAKVFIGSKGGIIKQAVIWVKTDEDIHRTI